MGKIETYNGDFEKIVEQGNKLNPEERIKYYEQVITDLYVTHGAFKRDLYMEGDSLKRKLEKEIEKVKEELSAKFQEVGVVKIKSKYGIADISRIFEAMKEAGVIEEQTEVKHIAQLFFVEDNEKNKFVSKYNASKNDIKKNFSSSNSKELLEFIKILIKNNFSKKENELLELESFVSSLQN